VVLQLPHLLEHPVEHQGVVGLEAAIRHLGGACRAANVEDGLLVGALLEIASYCPLVDELFVHHLAHDNPVKFGKSSHVELHGLISLLLWRFYLHLLHFLNRTDVVKRMFLVLVPFHGCRLASVVERGALTGSLHRGRARNSRAD
jgi:hypothetical protein